MCQPQESTEMGVEDQVPLMSIAEQPLVPWMLAYTHLSALTSALNIPQMNHVTFKAREREIGKAIEKVAEKSCLKAIEAEKENALKGNKRA